MNKKRNSVDGFIPRRSDASIQHAQAMAQRAAALDKTFSLTPHQSDVGAGKRISSRGHKSIGTSTGSAGINRSQIEDSLRGIEDVKDTNRKQSRRERRRQKHLAHPRRRKLKLFFIAFFVLAVLGVAGFVGYRTMSASNNIFQGNIFGVFQQQQLKQDANGRSNILIFGTAEDDEGGTHDGANLTDSIMLLSIDQTKKNAYMLSIPRDLWVRYPETCVVGNEGKINAAYFCASNDGENEAAGSTALMSKVGELTGLDIQYYAHLNFSVVVDAVNAVGGVDLTIESADPRGILDRNFDWKCNYSCYYVNYKNGEQVHLDGEHALALARARNASGGYGLPNGNFDRERNQQKVMMALREKALSAGTLTNVGKITGLVDALGNNLRTNFQTSEIRSLMSLGEAMTNDNIHQLTLVDEEGLLVTTGSYNGQSIVRPVADIYDYSEIIEYVRDSVASTPLSREKANIAVLNGSGVAGVAQTQANKLAEAGFKVGTIDNAPEGTYQAVEVYQISDDKPLTAEELKKLYGVTIKTTPPPLEVAADVNFVIIYGQAPATPTAD